MHRLDRFHSQTAVRFVVVGAAGFIGTELCGQLREKGHIVAELDYRGSVPVDIRSSRALSEAIGAADCVVHLAALRSAACEREPERAFDVNVVGTRNVLQAVARNPRGGVPTVVFASSIAVCGSRESNDESAPRPTSVYGTTKAIGELLVADHARRTCAPALSVRIPTVLVRPDASDEAVSGFASRGLVEALNGRPAVFPVEPDTALIVSDVITVASNIIDISMALIVGKPLQGTINLPGVRVTAADLAAQCAALSAAPIHWRHDAIVARIIESWPTRWVSSHADRLVTASVPALPDIVSRWRKQSS